MERLPLLAELKHSKELESWARSGEGTAPVNIFGEIAKNVVLKLGYRPVRIPSEGYRSARFAGEAAEDLWQESTFVISVEVVPEFLPDLRRWAREEKRVVGLFSNVQVGLLHKCPVVQQSATTISHDYMDVRRKLCSDTLQKLRMDGNCVDLAIVDDGFSRSMVETATGKVGLLDLDEICSQSVTGVHGAGMAPDESHGTMCAASAAIMAPEATFLDLKVPEGFCLRIETLLTVYDRLRCVMNEKFCRGSKGMVVNNSWQLYSLSDDFPLGCPENYSDNPNHPIEDLVSTLAAEGADQIFPSGNCGTTSGDGRCGQPRGPTIYGANSHIDVLCVTAVDLNGEFQGYAGLGPGHLTRLKPDLAAFTEFLGKNAFRFSRTSAACALAAGCVAAIRSRVPYEPSDLRTHPAAIRQILIDTAKSCELREWNPETGFGALDMCAVLQRLDELNL